MTSTLSQNTSRRYTSGENFYIPPTSTHKARPMEEDRLHTPMPTENIATYALDTSSYSSISTARMRADLQPDSSGNFFPSTVIFGKMQEGHGVLVGYHAIEGAGEDARDVLRLVRFEGQHPAVAYKLSQQHTNSDLSGLYSGQWINLAELATMPAFAKDPQKIRAVFPSIDQIIEQKGDDVSAAVRRSSR